MKTITAEFVYEGKTYTLTAKLTNNGKLSSSKDNMATKIIATSDGICRWSLYFEGISEDFDVELVMYLDVDDSSNWRYEADYAILWSRHAPVILAEVDITAQRVRFS